MSLMTDWAESDITRWPEDDDPETHMGGDDDDADLRLKWQGVLTFPMEVDNA